MHIGLLLFPKLTQLDLTGPIESPSGRSLKDYIAFGASSVIGAQPRARRWRVLRTPAVKRATETTVLAPIRQGAGEL